MFNYYCALALRSLRRNVVLTALMIAAIGVGIAASMTTLTVYRSMAANPIPGKSQQLWAVQIDNWGVGGGVGPGGGDNLQDQLSYTDATGLMNTHGARRQVAMYASIAIVTPADPQVRPFQLVARATYGDFFPMFNVPFRFGAGWSAADDDARAAVVVISSDLNDRLFGGANSVGKMIHLQTEDYRVVGVLDRWEPVPRFYDLDGAYSKPEDLFLPFRRAIEQRLAADAGDSNCSRSVGKGWEGFLFSDCVWIQFWAELPTDADVRRYRSLLTNYAAEQQRAGRFHWAPRTQLRDVQQWLSYHHLVSDEVRIMVLVSLSFLAVCLLNATGLMLAKIVSRAADIGVRRALGASRRAIFVQCLIETAVVGLVGGLLGLLLTGLGLKGLGLLISEEGRLLLHLDAMDVAIAILLAVTVTVIAGLYPTWRAARLQPALQLKSL